MKPDLLEILCCPVCHGDLTLRASRTEKGEVVDGALLCAKCHEEYPIDDGIPNLLPPDDRD